jgi:hypothetical protein
LDNCFTFMATVINNPGQTSDNSGTGVVIGILLVVFLAILFLMFGLPYLRNRGTAEPSGTSASINVDLPTGGGANSGGTGASQ